MPSRLRPSASASGPSPAFQLTSAQYVERSLALAGAAATVASEGLARQYGLQTVLHKDSRDKVDASTALRFLEAYATRASSQPAEQRSLEQLCRRLLHSTQVGVYGATWESDMRGVQEVFETVNAFLTVLFRTNTRPTSFLLENLAQLYAQWRLHILHELTPASYTLEWWASGGIKHTVMRPFEWSDRDYLMAAITLAAQAWWPVIERVVGVTMAAVRERERRRRRAGGEGARERERERGPFGWALECVECVADCLRGCRVLSADPLVRSDAQALLELQERVSVWDVWEPFALSAVVYEAFRRSEQIIRGTAAPPPTTHAAQPPRASPSPHVPRLHGGVGEGEVVEDDGEGPSVACYRERCLGGLMDLKERYLTHFEKVRQERESALASATLLRPARRSAPSSRPPSPMRMPPWRPAMSPGTPSVTQLRRITPPPSRSVSPFGAPRRWLSGPSPRLDEGPIARSSFPVPLRAINNGSAQTAVSSAWATPPWTQRLTQQVSTSPSPLRPRTPPRVQSLRSSSTVRAMGGGQRRGGAPQPPPRDLAAERETRMDLPQEEDRREQEREELPTFGANGAAMFVGQRHDHETRERGEAAGAGVGGEMGLPEGAAVIEGTPLPPDFMQDDEEGQGRQQDRDRVQDRANDTLLPPPAAAAAAATRAPAEPETTLPPPPPPVAPKRAAVPSGPPVRPLLPTDGPTAFEAHIVGEMEVSRADEGADRDILRRDERQYVGVSGGVGLGRSLTAEPTRMDLSVALNDLKERLCRLEEKSDRLSKAHENLAIKVDRHLTAPPPAQPTLSQTTPAGDQATPVTLTPPQPYAPPTPAPAPPPAAEAAKRDIDQQPSLTPSTQAGLTSPLNTRVPSDGERHTPITPFAALRSSPSPAAQREEASRRSSVPLTPPHPPHPYRSFLSCSPSDRSLLRGPPEGRFVSYEPVSVRGGPLDRAGAGGVGRSRPAPRQWIRDAPTLGVSRMRGLDRERGEDERGGVGVGEGARQRSVWDAVVQYP
ncbi:unnamed protein product [Vitrella brassicaformis CCMP3155]|uniref:Uncharacterized protein n=4 Tax=Vitrella brassicaformis TaxID=1169539 RepID=A0A0G4FVC1_VITBC|nr:unnamed protein product [Vitrella brassicaformis CCMP3155]|eukprot:CEM18635.1 unnamed protein product [Vitrella brassicaformis CCMP3155]